MSIETENAMPEASHQAESQATQSNSFGIDTGLLSEGEKSWKSAVLTLKD